MKRLQRAAVLLSLIEAMKNEKSWCGETNIQKASYFLQELGRVPLEFDFILYKYGPYSFELTDELTALCADSILNLEIRDPRYGPSYVAGELEELVKTKFPKTIARYKSQVDFVARQVGSKRVAELECLATALYVRLEEADIPSAKDRAAKIKELKPHISQAEADEAVKEVDEMWGQAENLPQV